ncbi:MAG TPA: 16S rRNA (adenine(1518)-N(6)/adenine(1519)-N(6))-dimethyltransferase RsmA [Geobacteraceae bacterium]
MDKTRPKKALGQNFLTDNNVLAKIVAAAGISAGDRVMEIGPGRGSLTRLLADRGARVVAVEIDRDLVPLLEREFAGRDNVEIVRADILDQDLGQLLLPRGEGKWKVVANLPYNISSQVLIRLLDNRELFSRLVLMLQREVGERLVAPPACKEYGILTLFLRLHFDVFQEFIVRPGSFYPPPKVDSVVLRFEPLPAPRADVGDEAFFRRVVKGAFGQRRKTLWNCLKAAMGSAGDDPLARALAECGIDGKRRGETLNLDEFAALSRELFRSLG